MIRERGPLLFKVKTMGFGRGSSRAFREDAEKLSKEVWPMADRP